MLKKLKIIYILLFLVSLLNLSAEGRDTKKEKLTPVLKDWKDTLLYGIGSEVMDVIKRIRESKERSLDKELLTVLKESKNIEVSKLILNYFEVEKNYSALDYATKVLDKYDDKPEELVISTLSYIGLIAKSRGKESDTKLREKLKKDLINIIDNGSTGLAALAIKTLGSLKYSDQAEYLLKKYNDSETDEKLKPEIILALGNMKSEKAVDELIKIVKDKDNDKILRMYASNALGMIGDKRAIPVLQQSFDDKNALIRVYAASALSQLEQSKDTIDLLIQGLKDSNWRVRLECAKALGKISAKAAVNILEYKVKHDPVKKVQIEALRTLGKIGGKEVTDFLKRIFKNKNQAVFIREEALSLLTDKDFVNSKKVIKEVLENSSKIYDKIFIQRIARIVSLKETKDSGDLLQYFIRSNDPIARIYALRGIAKNNLKKLYSTVQDLSENDPVKAVKKEALSVLKKLK